MIFRTFIQASLFLGILLGWPAERGIAVLSPASTEIFSTLSEDICFPEGEGTIQTGISIGSTTSVTRSFSKFKKDPFQGSCLAAMQTQRISASKAGALLLPETSSIPLFLYNRSILI